MPPRRSSSSARPAIDRRHAPVAGDDGKRQFVKELEDALLDARRRSPSTARRTCRRAARGPRDRRLPAARRSARRDRPPGGPMGRLSGEPRFPAASAVARADHRHGQRPPRGAARSDVPGGDVRADSRQRRHPAARSSMPANYDALVLACAGLRRLGFDERISAAIPFDRCVPAPGQGIVALEIRADDERTRQAVARSITMTRPARRWRPSGRWSPRSAAGVSCRSAPSPSRRGRRRARDDRRRRVARRRRGWRRRRSAAAATRDAAALGARVAGDLGEGAGAIELLE